MFYPISFIAACTLLILWFKTKDREGSAQLFSKMFFIVMAMYAANLLFKNAPFDVKLFALSRDLIVMGGLAFFSSLFLKKKQFFILFLGIIGFLVGKYYLPIMNTTFEKQTEIFATDSNSEMTVPFEYDESWELLVDLKEGAKMAELTDILTKYNITEFEQAFNTNDPIMDDYYVVNIPTKRENQFAEILAALEKSNLVDYAEGNEILKIEPLRRTPLPKINRKFGVDDPGLSNLWGFEAMEVDKLYNYLKDNKIKPKKKAKIAILDTGVDGKHEDLSARFFSTKPAYDVDVVGHGTHCAGIAAAVTNNGIGVASFSPTNDFVEVTSIKVLNDFGGGTQRTVINGILEAADLGADVISMSLGGRSNSSRLKAYKDAVKYATKKNAIVVVAAGNSNMNAKHYSPANTPGVITVSAVDTLLNRAGFSNYIQDLEMGIAAPGVKIYSTTPTNSRNGKYASFNGTSMATPYVAGLVGLMRSLNPKIKTKEVYSILKETGKATKNTQKTGRLIFPFEAVKKAAS